VNAVFSSSLALASISCFICSLVSCDLREERTSRRYDVSLIEHSGECDCLVWPAMHLAQEPQVIDNA